MKREKVDVLVIGAGPAGTIAASILHQNGLSVKIVEKEIFPRFVIGESLLPRCMEHIEAAGFMDALKARKYQEKTGALFIKNGEICDFNFSDQFTPEARTWAWQVPRSDFDHTLAKEVEKQGVPVEYQTSVQKIDFFGTDSITSVTCPDHSTKEIEAKFIVDASGYGRVIPRLFGLDKPSSFPKRKTLFSHLEDPNRPEGMLGHRITIVIHEQQTWIWIIPFSNGITSVGFVSEPAFFEPFNGTPEERLKQMITTVPTLQNRFQNPTFLFEPKTIEGYSISATKLYGDGFVLVGNSTEFLDPVFSSGVTFAMESAATAARLVVKQLAKETVNWEKDFVQHMMQGIDTFRTYVNHWYNGDLHDIFFTKQSNTEIKKQICSVLAGYAWDMKNPYVKKHQTAIPTLAEWIRMNA